MNQLQEKFKMSSKGNKIVFAGGIVTDLVTVTPRFPKPGETLIGKSYSTGFGGKTPNQCFIFKETSAQYDMQSVEDCF